MNAKNHAKLFEVRGRQVLAYLDHDEEQDNLLVMRLRLWSDTIEGPIEAGLTISSEEPLSEKAAELWEKRTFEGFDSLTADKVDEILDKMSVWSAVARVEGSTEIEEGAFA